MPTRVNEDWLLTPYRVAIHEPTNTAVIADVHLGYREARQLTGDAVPLVDVNSQLTPLRIAHQHFNFSQLFVAGDLFERGVDRNLLRQFLTELSTMNIALVGLVPGNHDRGWQAVQDLAAIHAEGAPLGRWRIVHQEPEPATAQGENPQATASDAPNLILGHWHPAVNYRQRRLPCYLVGPNRIILPAFSMDAAGVTLGDRSSWRGMKCFGILGGRVIDCSETTATGAAKNPRRGIRGSRRGPSAAARGRN